MIHTQMNQNFVKRQIARTLFGRSIVLNLAEKQVILQFYNNQIKVSLNINDSANIYYLNPLNYCLQHPKQVAKEKEIQEKQKGEKQKEGQKKKDANPKIQKVKPGKRQTIRNGERRYTVGQQ